MADNLREPSNKTEAVDTRLPKTIGLLDLIMLGAGSAIGVSIFSVLQPVAQVAGSGLLVTIGLSAVPMCVFGIIYAVVSSINPRSGASFVWTTEYISPTAGFMLSWLRLFGSVGQLTTFVLVLISYLSAVVPIPPVPGMLAAFVLLGLLNVNGLKFAARAQTILMFLLIAVLAVFVAVGAPHVERSNIFPLAPHGLWPIFLAAPLMISLFMGIESATEVGEEVKEAHMAVPAAIGAALLLVALIYLVVCVVAVGLVGAGALATSKTPLLLAATRASPYWATPIIVGAACFSLTKSLNSSFLIFVRLLFAMGRARALPTVLARLDPKRAVPRVATLVAFVCLCTGALLPQDLIFLFLASNIPTILKYLSISACALRISIQTPELTPRAALGLPPVVVGGLGILGMILAAGLFVLGFQTDWRPYALVGGWATIGLIYRFIQNRRTGRLKAAPSPGSA